MKDRMFSSLRCGPTAQNPQDASGSLHVIENGDFRPLGMGSRVLHINGYVVPPQHSNIAMDAESRAGSRSSASIDRQHHQPYW
jgi:hypothetical protein